MTRTKWGLILASIFIAIFVLSFDYPLEGELRTSPAATPEVSAQVTATRAEATKAMPSATSTPPPIAAPTATFTATPSPTQTAKPSPTPTATVSPTPTATASPTATATASPTASPTPDVTPLAFRNYPELPRYVYIDQGTQHVYVLEYGELVREIPCSTGLPNSDSYTPAWSGTVGDYWGTFFAYDVYADEAWYLFKSAGSILIHSSPYTLTAQEEKVYLDRDLLGQRPASHGCVRISPEDAAWFTAWGPQGVPITVTEPFLDKWR